MIREINFMGWRFVFFAKKIHKTVGVNSILKDGNHVLFFDFDNVEFHKVCNQLSEVQDKYHLSDIVILSTGRPNSFHAFCFTRTPLNKALQVCLDCPDIDRVFLMMALKRGWFTLRISEKNGRKPEYLATLASKIPADCNTNDLNKFTIYETGKS